MDLYVFWRNSVFCGLLARALAKQCNIDDHERFFVMGLLRDVGHLVMYAKIPHQSRTALLRAGDRRSPLYLAEREIIG